VPGGRPLPRARAAALVALAVAATSCSDLPSRPQPLVPVRGVIRDRDGATIGYTVLLFSRAEEREGTPQWPPPPDPVPPFGGRVVCDADGAFSVTLYAGRYDIVLLPPDPSSYGPSTLHDFALTRERPNFDYTFTGAWVHGHLYGPGGQLLEGGTVGAWSSGQGEYRSQSAVVRSGRYALLLPPGTWNFEAWAGSSDPGLPTVYRSGVGVQSDTTIDFTLDGERVTGMVSGPGGGPLADAMVAANGPTSVAAHTDGTGSFTMFAPDGDYRWSVRPAYDDAYIAAREFFAPVAGPTSLAFDLSGVRWTGSVRLAGSGAPVAGAGVFVVCVSGAGVSARAFTDATGGFEVVVPPQLLYRVQISPPAGIAQSFTSRYIGAVSDSTLDFTLDPAAPAGRLTTREARRSWSPGAP